MLKRMLSAFLVVLTLFLCSCEKETFSHCEMTIPLDESFERIDLEGFDAAFSDGLLSVALTRISFDAAVNNGIPDTLSSNQFARFWLIECGRDVEPTLYGGVDCAEYTDVMGGISYTTVGAFYRSKYAYFIVVFTTESSTFDVYRESVYRYLSGVYFTDPK